MKIKRLFSFFIVVIVAVLFVSCHRENNSSLDNAGDNSKDTEPPKIVAPTSVVGYVGDKPAFKKLIEVTDDNDVDIEVDADKVNMDKAGTYYVYYTVTDKAGNVSEYRLKYVVKSREYTRDILMSRIEALIEEGEIDEKKTTAAQIREIYSYVNSESTIYFTDESNIPNIGRENWDKEEEWIEEAIRTLDTEEGDCYSYYALSKAFFEYFEIKNYGIKRAEGYKGATKDGTHFWNVVEVDGAYYYYDATRLNGAFEDGTKNACLITQEKLDSYVPSKGNRNEDVPDYFYKMTSADRNKWENKISKKELK